MRKICVAYAFVYDAYTEFLLRVNDIFLCKALFQKNIRDFGVL